MTASATVTTPTTPAARAARALALAPSAPEQARAEALAARRQGGAAGDAEVVAAAELALGAAAKELHELPRALRHLRRAVAVAEAGGMAAQAARARVVLAGALAAQGDLDGAVREIDRAEPMLHGGDLGRLHLQRANILHVQGRLDEAMELYRRALPVLQRDGDRLHEAKLRNNRAMAASYRGALKAAEADLRQAEQLYRALGLERLAADVGQNLGYVAAFRGDLPAALASFDQADAYFRANGIIDAVGLRDRCEALLPAGLVVEARQAAEEAVRQLAREGRASFLAEARLLLSGAALADGDSVSARIEAEEAKRAFVRQRRPRWVNRAQYAVLRAAWAGGERSPALLAAARRAARALAAAGWVELALDARLIAAHLALELGRVDVARNQLAGADRARRRGPVDLRARAWHAEALLRLANGDRAGAERALRAGMRVLDNFRAALGATELRAHVSAHAAELARLGLRLALDRDDPVRVLTWAERWRASALRLRPVRPPGDDALEADLAELRRVLGEAERAVLAGRDATRLRRRQAALELAIQRRARQGDRQRDHQAGGRDAAEGRGQDRRGLEPAGSGGAASLADADGPSPAGVRGLTALLGERALVEMVTLDGWLHAVVLAGGRCALRRLSRLDEVGAELGGLRFGLRRLALRYGSAASLRAAADAAAQAAGRIDELLLGPLRDLVGARPLVVVPTGVLHALPWSTLPSLAGRPVSVAPSAALWQRAAATAGADADVGRAEAAAVPGGRGGGVVIVGGPGLPGAAAEVAALAERYPDATCLAGADATVAAVAAALDGAALAHVAAHGDFRADNPMFSCLQLADGPLTVYDLEGLRRAPQRLVLSACDAGLSGVRPGDELMGLTGALFALGTSALIASVVPIPDADTRDAALALHQQLQAGVSPAEALARLRAEPGHDHDAARFSPAAGFVCFGAG